MERMGKVSLKRPCREERGGGFTSLVPGPQETQVAVSMCGSVA